MVLFTLLVEGSEEEITERDLSADEGSVGSTGSSSKGRGQGKQQTS